MQGEAAARGKCSKLDISLDTYLQEIQKVYASFTGVGDKFEFPQPTWFTRWPSNPFGEGRSEEG